MIISDTHRFCFIHIPKSAGTWVRDRLQPFDDRNGFYSEPKAHKEFEILDYGHIPLKELSLFFPNEFERIKNYEKFAVVRDPYKRFPSSVAQRMKWFSGKPMTSLSLNDVQKEVRSVIEFLSENNLPGALPANFIHFQRQIDFLTIDGVSFVSNVYPTHRLDCMMNSVSELINHPLNPIDIARKNNATVYRSTMARLVAGGTRRVVGSTVWNHTIRGTFPMVDRLLFIPFRERFNQVFSSDSVRDFIRHYYKSDIEMFHELSN